MLSNFCLKCFRCAKTKKVTCFHCLIGCPIGAFLNCFRLLIGSPMGATDERNSILYVQV